MSTSTIHPYLFLGGHCQEAIDFYRQAVGAEVQMQMLYRDSPDPTPPGMLPPGFESKVMHATLSIGGDVLMMSDGAGEPLAFQGFSLSLAFPSEAEARRAFDALAEGGQVQMPITETFWSPCFGMLKDRFGVGWMVTVTAPPSG